LTERPGNPIIVRNVHSLGSKAGAQSILSRDILLFTLGILLCSGCGPTVTTKVTVAENAPRISRIAVADFRFEWEPDRRIGRYTYVCGKDAGTIIADAVTTCLLGTGLYDVVERSQLKRLLQEHDLRLSDLSSGADLEKAGKILNINGIVLGNVSYFLNWTDGVLWGTKVAYSMRLVDVKTGSVIWSASGSMIRHVSNEDPVVPLTEKITAELREKLRPD